MIQSYGATFETCWKRKKTFPKSLRERSPSFCWEGNMEMVGKCTYKICDVNEPLICLLSHSCRQHIKAKQCRIYKTVNELVAEVMKSD